MLTAKLTILLISLSARFCLLSFYVRFKVLYAYKPVGLEKLNKKRLKITLVTLSHYLIPRLLENYAGSLTIFSNDLSSWVKSSVCP